jgi:3',5'-cyclic AMP phosphodiesterase CpdA
VLIAHLSDLHLDLGRRSAERVRTVVEHVRALSTRPDLTVVTGDVADHGEAAEYDQAAELLDGLGAFLVPGNHDARPTMRALLGLPDGAPFARTTVVGDTTVLLADSLVAGHDHGELSPESLALLAEVSTRPGPLVVALHHPPLPVGSALLDPIRLRDPESLLAPLRGRDDPAVVLCGHAHTALSATVDGVPVRIAPGVASTLRLSYEPDPDTLDRTAPPGLALHHLDERTGALHTHVRAFAT